LAMWLKHELKCTLVNLLR